MVFKLGRIIAVWPYPIPLISTQGPYEHQMGESRFFGNFPYSGLNKVFIGMNMTFR